MEYRILGKTGWQVSAVSFGAWAIGGSWGEQDDAQSMAALERAVELGVNFFDTADVYGDGRSERLLGELRHRHGDHILIATKAGRRLDPHTATGYTLANLTAFVERSLQNLDVEAIDLLQLHCPPTEVYARAETYAALDELARQGKIRHYGVSVEKIGEALEAIQHPGVQTVQIIFNIFRPRPAEEFFPEARKCQVGILARVPLASGLLSGKLSRESRFAEDDHRRYNRAGESFDQGETFSGIDYTTGLQAVEELRPLLSRFLPRERAGVSLAGSEGEISVPRGEQAAASMAQFALRWILMFPEVSCAIPGARNPSQVEENTAAVDLPPLSDETMRQVQAIYDRWVRAQVHHRW
jgi:aryl-alcohol dehydrogenase-like predicted oxidoreductase